MARDQLCCPLLIMVRTAGNSDKVCVIDDEFAGPHTHYTHPSAGHRYGWMRHHVAVINLG